jgi:hypothetical protein
VFDGVIWGGHREVGDEKMKDRVDGKVRQKVVVFRSKGNDVRGFKSVGKS